VGIVEGPHPSAFEFSRGSDLNVLRRTKLLLCACRVLAVAGVGDLANASSELEKLSGEYLGQMRETLCVVRSDLLRDVCHGLLSEAEFFRNRASALYVPTADVRAFVKLCQGLPIAALW
jgi:hypothetical protein